MFFVAVCKAKPCKFINCRILIQLLLFISKAACRNKLNVDLNALAGISHLLVRLGLVGCLCFRRRKQRQPFEDAVQAFGTAGISSFSQPVPKLHHAELRITSAHILNHFNFLGRVFVWVMMRTLGAVGKRFDRSVPPPEPKVYV